MPVGKVIVKHDRDRIVFLLQPALQCGDLILRDLKTWPAVPLKGSRLGQAAQAADQAARGHREVVFAIIGALDGDGEAVGDEEELALHLDFSGRHGGVMTAKCGALAAGGLEATRW